MTRRVVLVCGPPAAGKTTWVTGHAADGDDVVDLDAISQDLGAADGHNPPPRLRAAARTIRSDRERRVARMTTGTAWVIRSLPDAGERDRLARALGATEVVVLATPATEAKKRAAAASRPAETDAIIDRWWSGYRPSASRLEREIAPSEPQEGYPTMPDEAAENEQTQASTDDTTAESDAAEQAAEDSAGDSDGDQDSGTTSPEDKTAAAFDEARARDKIRKANAEAASLRKRLKELEPLAKKAKDAEDANKSETERLQAQLAERDQQITQIRARAVRSEVRALAAELFADSTDPEAHLDLGCYVGDDGEIDTDQIKADLAELLERKPHLGRPKPEPERKRPAPDKTQASGANKNRSKNPAEEFAGFFQSQLKARR